MSNAVIEAAVGELADLPLEQLVTERDRSRVSEMAPAIREQLTRQLNGMRRDAFRRRLEGTAPTAPTVSTAPVQAAPAAPPPTRSEADGVLIREFQFKQQRMGDASARIAVIVENPGLAAIAGWSIEGVQRTMMLTDEQVLRAQLQLRENDVRLSHELEHRGVRSVVD